MSERTILVACIGNIFMGDDAFGVEVAQLLLRRPLPDGVKVVDFGIRGFDLTYAIMDGYDATILVDAVQRGGAPGTLYVIEPNLDDMGDLETQMVETHGMHPAKVLQLVKSMGADPGYVLLVACEPETFGPEEGYMGLSEPVQLAVVEAAEMVMKLVEQILSGERVASKA
ncbi:MAG: hydrogenase maturation protease [Chloroflexia bacterium]